MERLEIPNLEIPSGLYKRTPQPPYPRTEEVFVGTLAAFYSGKTIALGNHPTYLPAKQITD